MRLHLTLALITALALFLTLRAARQHRFTIAEVDGYAKHRAASMYVGPPDALPPQLRKLTPEQDAGIFSKETARLWRRKGLPFQVDFYPQLNSNPLPHHAPTFYYVDDKGSHLLPASSTYFNFFNVATNPPQPLVLDPPLTASLPFAGFYLRYPDMAIGSNPSLLDGFFSALGSNYFRVLAKEQVYGLSSRGIAINPGLAPSKQEEFPLFINWWLHVPTGNATELVLDALMDGPSVAGAYQFRIRPGAVTSVDVQASLYFRSAVDRLGIAPFSSMYIFGENAKDHLNDNVHPELHDSDGVLVHTGDDEWVWHPLQQQPFLQNYMFAQNNPKGFGILQRDRDFTHYQDLNAKYNVRPSAWVTPRGDWGKGEVSLVQLNSRDFNTDNVVLFWHPAQPVKAGDHLTFNYSIDFYMNDANRPPLAHCQETLINNPAPPPTQAIVLASSLTPVAGKPGPPPASAPKTNTLATAPPVKAIPPSPAMGPPKPAPPAIPTGTTPVQFLVDFAGDGIENTPANQPPDLDLSYDPPGTYLREKTVEKNGYDNSWRVTFTIIPLKHFVPTNLRCRLMSRGRPITETWSYVWHQ